MSSRKQPHTLPKAERFCPVSEAEAVLIFGSKGTKTVRNYFSKTDAAPGTAAKIEVLRDRASRRLPLWHPQDRRDCEGLPASQGPKPEAWWHFKENNTV